MANRDRNLNRILKEVASQCQSTFVEYSLGWIIALGQAGRIRFVFGYTFDLNPAGATKIASDKAATVLMLQAKSVSAVEHLLFLRPSLQEYVEGEGNWPAITSAVNDFGGFPVVVKPNHDSSSGSGVFMAEDQRDLEVAVDSVFSASRGLALSPFVEIVHEYRVVILDGIPLLVFEKVPGDDWRHNLSRGATPKVIELGSRADIEELAVKATSALGLRFCAVDIVDDGTELKVLEVNAGVMLETFSRVSDEYYQLAYNVYEAAVKAMLEG